MPLNTLQLARGLNPVIEAFALGSGAIYNLPSNGVKAGQTFLLYNTTTNNSELAIKSSAGNTVETIAKGHCFLLAAQDSPTTASHWNVIDVLDELNNLTVTWGGCIPSTNTTGNSVVRRNKQVTGYITAFASDVTANASDSLVSNVFMPTRMTTSAGGAVGICRVKNGTNNNFIRWCPVRLFGNQLIMFSTLLDINSAGAIFFSSGNTVTIWEQAYLQWRLP
jgi:hypothetical protein